MNGPGEEVGIDALRDAIRGLHGCESTCVKVEHVKETFRGETVWEGDVHVFALAGHLQAKRAYAWSYQTSESGRRRFMAVLELGPVKDATTAVRAAIVADSKR